MRNTTVMLATEINPERQSAKAKRKMGMKFLKCTGEDKVRDKLTLDSNSQKYDPLFKVKGIARHRLKYPPF